MMEREKMQKDYYFDQAKERQVSFGARLAVEKDFPGEPPFLYKNGLLVAARGEPIKVTTLVKGVCFYEDLTIRDLAAAAVMRYYSEKGVKVKAVIPDEENKIFHGSSGKFLNFLEDFIGYFVPKATIFARSRNLDETFRQLNRISLAIPTSKILRVLKKEVEDPETVTFQYGDRYPTSQIIDLLVALSDIMAPAISDPKEKVLVVAEPPKDNYVLLARESIGAITDRSEKEEEIFHGLYYLYPPRLTRTEGKFNTRKYLTIGLSGNKQKEVNERILRSVPKASDGMSLKEFQAKGANPLNCPVFQYGLYSDAVFKDLGLSINMPLKEIKRSCRDGNIKCQDCKNCLLREPHKQGEEILKDTFGGKIM